MEFERLFEEHRKVVQDFFERRGAGDESQDLVQLTFLKAYRNIGHFRKEASYKTWLLKIARNTWINQVRKWKSEKAKPVKWDEWEVSVEDSNPRHIDPLSKLILDEKSQYLHSGLNKLPPQMKQCIYLRVCQDLKYKEIAHVMRININTVKSHLSQAREKLAGFLGDQFNLDLEG